MIGLALISNEVRHNFRKQKFPGCFTLAILFLIVLSCEFSATASSKYISSIKDGHVSSNTHQQIQSTVEDLYKTENVLTEPVPEDEITNILDYDIYSIKCGKDCENDLVKEKITGTSEEHEVKKQDHFGPIAYEFFHHLFDLLNRTVNFLYDFEPYLMQGNNKELDKAYCHNDDLKARFDCLKNNLLVVLRNLNMQQSLKLSEGIQLEHHHVTNASDTERSFSSDIWNTITSFFNSRVLSISVSKFVEGLMPTSVVTKARILEYEDSLQHLFESIFEEKDTDSESRGKKKKKKFKKAIIIAIMTKAAIAAKVVLAGVVLLAKKALMVSIVSLILSLIAAKKKKSSGKGDDHRRKDYFSDYIECD